MDSTKLKIGTTDASKESTPLLLRLLQEIIRLKICDAIARATLHYESEPHVPDV